MEGRAVFYISGDELQLALILNLAYLKGKGEYEMKICPKCEAVNADYSTHCEMCQTSLAHQRIQNTRRPTLHDRIALIRTQPMHVKVGKLIFALATLIIMALYIPTVMKYAIGIIGLPLSAYFLFAAYTAIFHTTWSFRLRHLFSIKDVGRAQPSALYVIFMQGIGWFIVVLNIFFLFIATIGIDL